MPKGANRTRCTGPVLWLCILGLRAFAGMSGSGPDAATAAGIFAISKTGFDKDYAPARERGGSISVLVC